MYYNLQCTKFKVFQLIGCFIFSWKVLSTDIMAATQFVKDAIAHDPIVLFTKSDCGYCDMVKEVKVQIWHCSSAIVFNSWIYVSDFW